MDALADGGLGPGRARRRGPRAVTTRAGSAASASPSPAALAGLAYGALLDLSVMVTYGGEQSLDRYLALSARGVPFNVAHAVGNFALALAAGPALVRMISRYRSRFEFEWPGAPALDPRRCRATSADRRGVACRFRARGRDRWSPARRGARADGPRSACAWLERAQNSDGGFAASPGSGSSAAMTGWAMLGLEASGVNPLDVRRGGRSPIDFLRADRTTIRSTGDLERTILALDGAGRRARGGSEAATSSAELRTPPLGDGSFEGQVNLTAFGRPRSARGRSPTASALASLRLLAARCPERRRGLGLPARRPGATPTAPGRRSRAWRPRRAGAERRAAGASYLRSAQRGDGGFALAGTGSSNAQSTAWAIQGLLAAGRIRPRSATGGDSPLGYLAARQAGDGHYRYSASSDQTPVWVTAQALLAVKRKPFPLAAVPRAPTDGRSAPRGGVGPSSGGGGCRIEWKSGNGHRASGGKRRRPGRAGGRTAAPERGRRGARVGRDGGSSGRRGRALSSDHGASRTTAYVVGGFGALIAALTAGFFWYRRRLP